MTDRHGIDKAAESRQLALLAAYGAALERWPDGDAAAAARRRLVADPGFRAAWEAERGLDRALAGLGEEIDGGIARDCAAERVRTAVMARLPRPPAGIGWRSLAAAMLLAAFLGGAVQSLRPPAHAEPLGPALLDPALPEFEEPLG